MAGYYDFVLGAIPIAAASIAIAFFLGGLVVSTAISLGCVGAAALVGHAMFVRTPGSTAEATGPGSRPAPDVAD